MVYLRAFGADAAGAPVTSATRFAIGELERQFTAASALALAEAGALDLDAPLPAGIVPPGAESRAPTLRELLHQVSGLAPIDSTGTLRLALRPGAWWTETRAHYAAARRALAERSEQPYEAGIAALAARAGLTSFEAVRAESMACTPADLVRWSRALDRGGVLPATRVREMMRLRTLPDGREWPYGLGLELQTIDSHAKVMHAGSGPGATAVLSNYPADSVAIAVMAGVPSLWSLPALERRLARVLLAMPGRLPPEQPYRPTDFGRVIGEYECGALAFGVQREDEGLLLVVRSSEHGARGAELERHPLRHLGDGRLVSTRDPDAVHVWFKRGNGPANEIVVGWFGLPAQAVRRPGS